MLMLYVCVIRSWTWTVIRSHLYSYFTVFLQLKCHVLVCWHSLAAAGVIFVSGFINCPLVVFFQNCRHLFSKIDVLINPLLQYSGHAKKNRPIQNFANFLTTIENYYIKFHTVVTHSVSYQSLSFIALCTELTKLCCI